jgi:hypothetical protein
MRASLLASAMARTRQLETKSHWQCHQADRWRHCQALCLRPSGRDCLTFFRPLQQGLEGSHLLPLGLAIGDAIAEMLAILEVDLATVMVVVDSCSSNGSVSFSLAASDAGMPVSGVSRAAFCPASRWMLRLWISFTAATARLHSSASLSMARTSASP